MWKSLQPLSKWLNLNILIFHFMKLTYQSGPLMGLLVNVPGKFF